MNLYFWMKRMALSKILHPDYKSFLWIRINSSGPILIYQKPINKAVFAENCAYFLSKPRKM